MHSGGDDAMANIGLVLSGGGGKGAYEIGALNYLIEAGIDRNIRAVSGTSVGALNAAIFASGNYEKALQIWKRIKPDQILSERTVSKKDALNWIAKVGITQATPSVLAHIMWMVMGFSGVALTAVSPLALALPGIVATGASIKNMTRIIDNSFIFSRDGLLQLIEQGVDFDALRKSPFPCYVTCLAVTKRFGKHMPVISNGVDVPWASIERFDLRSYTDGEIKKLLLASSAIPVVFDAVEFHGRQYFDGGIPQIGDNTPISPIYENVTITGVEKIIVICLSSKARRFHRFPSHMLCVVKPKESLGNKMTGTLNFTSEYAKKLITLGYEDAKEQLSPMLNELI